MLIAAATIITEAMKSARIIDPDESLSAAEMNHNLARLNRMLDFWSVKRLTVFVRMEDTKVLTVGQGSYSIGTNGAPNINTTRPVKIEQAYLRDTTNSLDIPIDCDMTQEEYNGFSLKNITALPSRLLYKNTVPNGTIQFDYLPDKAYEAHFFSVKPLTAFADLTTEYDFPPGYEAALTSNLAVLLANDYEATVTELMAFEATQTLDAIKTLNLEIPQLSCELAPGTRGRTGSILTL